MKIETPRIYLPRTGQTTSYATGDDGDLQAGNPRATRFVDNGNGTVTDRATGLQWVKQPEFIIPGAVGIDDTNQVQAARGNWADARAYALADLVCDATDSKFYVCIHAHTSDDASGTDTDAPNTGSAYWRETVWTASAVHRATPATMTWTVGLAACLALEYAGFTDWRMPNVLELLTLVDVAKVGTPLIDMTVFPNTANGMSWTSTTDSWSTDYAHGVQFNSFYMRINLGEKLVDSINLRPVRGGRVNDNW